MKASVVPLTLLAILAAGAAPAQKNLPYFFSKDIRDTSYQENASIRHGYQSHLLYSYIGNYPAAINALNGQREVSANLDMSASGILPEPALPFLLKEAATYQIVIINEDHHRSSHRVFTASLLGDFYKMGFRYFAVEGLRSRKTDSLNIRKYPLLSDLSYYDPQFGNMLRKALSLNYRVLGHDTANFALFGGADPFLFDRTRDSLSARKIQAILEKDPSAKIIIHCGLSHGYECTFDENLGKRFAALVHEFTGIDPLTINQDHYQERAVSNGPSSRQTELPELALVRLGTAKYNMPCEDFAVTRSPTRFIHNRPHWLLTGNNQYFFPGRLLSDNQPRLALAFNAAEPIGIAVPVDVVEIDGKTSSTAMVLSPGRYNLLFIGTNYQQKIVVVTIPANKKP